MSTVDTNKVFVLENDYTGSDNVLSVTSIDSTALTMSSSKTITDRQRWFFTATDLPPFYYLQVLASGQNTALDVINDKGTNSVRLHMAATGKYSGQYWRLDPYEDAIGGYKISNNFTGLDMHLDVYSDTYEPHLANGDTTGQHWMLLSATDVANGATGTTSVGPSSTASGTTSGSVTPGTTGTSSPTAQGNSSSTATPQPVQSGLSPGAIAGIAVGGIAVIAVLVVVIGCLWRRKRQRGNDVGHATSGLVGSLSKSAASQYGHDNRHAVPIDNSNDPYKADTGPMPVYKAQQYNHGSMAELGTGGNHAWPAELPAQVQARAELSGDGRQ